MCRHSRPDIVLALLLLFAAAFGSATLSAQEAAAEADLSDLSPAEQAAALGEQGTALFQARQFSEAAIVFQQAYNLDPHPVLLFNIARAHEEMGDMPTALQLFRSLSDITDDPGILGAAGERAQRMADELAAQGYDPDTVTSADYVPRGIIEITSEPEGAEVILGAEVIGTTPLRQDRIDRGQYDLRVVLEGYHPVNTSVEVRGGGETIRSFTLQPRTSLDEYVPPEPGYLTVLSPQANMEVFVDGQRFSVTPIEQAPLAPGSYEVVVNAVGWLSYSTVIEITSGQNTTVQAQMTPIGGYERVTQNNGSSVSTALMIGGGTLLTTGTVLGILALTNSTAYNDNVSDPNRGQYRDSARTQALIGDITLLTGGAALVTGVVLRLVKGRNDQDDFGRGNQLVFTPTVPRDRHQGRWGLVMSGRF